jgi:hypothetical protein
MPAAEIPDPLAQACAWVVLLALGALLRRVWD